LHLEALAKQTGQPLRLKYSLRYLDAISDPDALRAYLDDVSTVGWIGSKLPQTSFVFARGLLGHSEEGGIMERNHLYTFSPEWKHALLQWFYAHQDPGTGYWGPRASGSGKLLRLDLDNTASIVKAFADRAGNDIHASFPLRYKPQMFATTLRVMSEPVPGDEDLDEWHGWTLSMTKGTRLLTRYLWKDASREHRDRAAKAIAGYIRLQFEKCFIPSEGAFSYYPASERATLDGTNGVLNILRDVGAFSDTTQQRLWGPREGTSIDLGRFVVPAISGKDLDAILRSENVNSVRFFPGADGVGAPPSEAAGVFYLRPTRVLDAVELLPRVRSWIENTRQSMGNWVSREQLSADLPEVVVGPVPVARGEIPLETLNLMLGKSGALTLICHDVLQVPVCRMTFQLASAPTRSR